MAIKDLLTSPLFFIGDQKKSFVTLEIAFIFNDKKIYINYLFNNMLFISI